jgi:hypothetical protein
MQKRFVYVVLPAYLAASMIAGATMAKAQIGFGSSTAGGSGGAPSGPTNPSGIYGMSPSGRSAASRQGPPIPEILGSVGARWWIGW